MRSIFSIRYIFGLFILNLIAIAFIMFGLYMIFFTNDFWSGITIFGSLIFIWLGFLLIRISVGSLKIVIIENNQIIIRRVIGSQQKVFFLNDLKYSDYLYIGKFGSQTGVIIKSSDGKIELIGSNSFTNSSKIISYIRDRCANDKSIKRPPMSKLDKLVFLTGGIIFILFIIFRFID